MAGFKEPFRRLTRTCEICEKLIEGDDPTDLMVRYGVHMRSHRARDLRKAPPGRAVDKFK